MAAIENLELTITGLTEALDQLERLAPLIERVDGRIGVLRLKPGDVLVFEVQHPIANVDSKRLTDQIVAHMPTGVRVIVLPYGIKLSGVKGEADDRSCGTCAYFGTPDPHQTWADCESIGGRVSPIASCPRYLSRDQWPKQ